METKLASVPILGGTRTAVALGASPATYQNTGLKRETFILSGGTVQSLEFSRDGTTFDLTGATFGAFTLAPLDRIRVTYTVIPTVVSAYQL